METGPFSSCWAMSSTSRIPYLPLVVSRMSLPLPILRPKPRSTDNSASTAV